MGGRARREGTLASVAASSAFLARNPRVCGAIRANASTQAGSARLVRGPGTLRSAPALRPVTRSAIGVWQPEMIATRPAAERGLVLIRRHSAQLSRGPTWPRRRRAIERENARARRGGDAGARPRARWPEAPRRRVACNAAAARKRFSSSAFRSGMGGGPFAHPHLQLVREQKRRHAPPGEHSAQPSHLRADVHRLVVTERGLPCRIAAASRRPRPP